MTTQLSLRRVLAVAAVPALLVALAAGGATAASASGGPPPPKGFEADSASFISATAGFVLGTRNCAGNPGGVGTLCPAKLVKTVNGGKTWTAVPAPAVKLIMAYEATPATAVSTVRFANASTGWLFNPGLWATHNGGKTWTRVKLPGIVNALTASNGMAFASVQPTNQGAPQSKLYQSKVGSNTWTLVKGVPPAGLVSSFGNSAWAGAPPALYRTTDNGKHWAKLSFRCPSLYPEASGVGAASAANVALVCWSGGDPQPGFSKKLVFASTNGGRTFSQVGRPPIAGAARTIAMVPGKPKLMTLTADSGASYLYQSTNGGSAWSTTTFFDGGLGTRDLAYVSATTGYLVHYNGGPVFANSMGLMKTVNAGKTWTTITIP
jgi:photosystem II stability/assembly factor-like uncharacterized protein